MDRIGVEKVLFSFTLDQSNKINNHMIQFIAIISLIILITVVGIITCGATGGG